MTCTGNEGRTQDAIGLLMTFEPWVFGDASFVHSVTGSGTKRLFLLMATQPKLSGRRRGHRIEHKVSSNAEMTKMNRLEGRRRNKGCICLHKAEAGRLGKRVADGNQSVHCDAHVLPVNVLEKAEGTRGRRVFLPFQDVCFSSPNNNNTCP